MLASQGQMQNHIEFHDSKLLAIDKKGESVRITLDAYVHRWEHVGGIWKGTGLSQLVHLVIAGAALPSSLELPVNIYTGEILADHVTHDNLVPLPFALSGSASLRLELQTGDVVSLNGSGGITIEPVTEGRFVEELPADFSPPAC